MAVVFIIAMGGAYLPPSDPGTEYEPEVHYVGAGGFEKVQDAIDFARPGDIIKVGPGEYNDPVNVNKPLSIIGDGPDSTYSTTYIVSANSVSLSDHTFINIYNNATAFDWDYGGIVTRQLNGISNSYISNLRVNNCIFRNCRQGVFLFGAKNCLVENSNFYGCYRGVTIRGHWIGNVETWTSYSNTIRDCNFYDLEGTGVDDGEAVAIHGSNSNTVDGCTMSRNSYGVAVYGGTGNVIKDCTITDSTYNPIWVSGATAGASSISVTGNTLTDNAENAEFVNSRAFTFSTNVIRGNGEPVTFNGCSAFTASTNTINGSSVLLQTSSRGTFASNVFEMSDEPSFIFSGSTKAYYDHTIGTTNTVGGNPIYYYDDTSSPTVTGGTAGAIIFAYCPSPTVDGVTVEDGDGIFVYYSGTYDIQADVKNCLYGINITVSDAGFLDDCYVNTSDRGWHGIHLKNANGGKTYDTVIDSPNSAPAWRLNQLSDHATYNSTFDGDLVEAVESLGGDLYVYNYLDIMVWDNGSMAPLDNVEVKVTIDDIPVYATPGYGGTDAVTDATGTIATLTLRDREYAKSNTATEHTHDINVSATIDAVWADGITDINMSYSRFLEFEASDIRAPATPGNLLVQDLPSEDAILITWDANVDDTLVYSLYSNITGSWNLLQNLSMPIVNYRIDSGLVHGVTYYFQITAWDEVPLESIRTAVVEVLHADALAPLAPDNLLLVEVTGTTVEMAWDANTEADIEGYHVYINESGGGANGPWVKLTPAEGQTTLTFLLENLMSETLYHFVVTALDEVPNESPLSIVLSISTLDITPPDVPIVDVLPDYTNAEIQPVTGTAEPDSTVTLFVNGEQMGTVIADDEGLFAIDATLTEGPNVITAWATDPSGNTGGLSDAWTVNYDKVAPAMPTIDDMPELTNVVTHTVTGIGEVYATITIMLNGEEVGNFTTGLDGKFELELDLIEGENTITAYATDRAKNIGPSATAVTVVLDTIAPNAPVIDTPPEYVNNEDLTLTGHAEPGSHVEILVGTDVVAVGDADSEGVFTIVVELDDRETSFKGRATDLASNLGILGDAVVVILDTEPPVVVAGADIEKIEDLEVTLDGSASTDNEGIASYNWTFTVNSVEVSFEDAIAKYTFADPSTVTVTLTVTDLAGNTATDTLEAVILIANQPPNLDLGNMDPEKGNTGTNFDFVVTYKDPDLDNGEVWVIIDGDSFLMTPDPDDTNTADGQTYIYETKLTEGTHSYYFTGRDSFGNDAVGPSAGDSNAKTSPEITKKKVEDSPSLSGAAVLLAAVAVATVLVRKRKRL